MSKDEQGKWRVRQSSSGNGTWGIANGNNTDDTTLMLCRDGVATNKPRKEATFPTQAAAQTALDAYLGKEKQVICDKTSECMTTACKCHGKHKRNFDCGNYCPCFPKVHCIPIEAEISEKENEVKWYCRRNKDDPDKEQAQYWVIANGPTYDKTTECIDFRGGVVQNKAYTLQKAEAKSICEKHEIEVNETGTSEKEQDMGQTLYTTAVAELRENDDGTFAIDSVNNEQTKDAESLNQAMISRHTTSVLSATKKEQIADIVGKEPDGTWKRMDQI